MAKLSANVTRAVIGVVVVAIVAVGVYFVFFNSGDKKTVTARFASAVGVYVGTPVRILGVGVGAVTSVKPGPQYVAVTMNYDAKYRIRAKDASAVEVANSLVSDRYINLGTLIGKDNPAAALKSGATIPVTRTGGPAELDQIYAALDKLSVALGPKGANAGGKSKGALSTLLKVAAANLKGNGAALGQSITKLAAAAETLADNKNGLFGTVKNLQKFVSTLKASDGQVRKFNEQLAEVAGDLASERADLGGALHELGVALNSVSTFVKDNASKFHTDISGLTDITKLLVRQKASLNETLAVAPVALANLVHSYNPENGSLGTRSNLISLTNLDLSHASKALCDVLDPLIKVVPGVGDVVNAVCGAAKKTTTSTTSTSSTSTRSADSTAASVVAGGSYVVDTMMNAGIPVGTLIGSGS